MEVSMIHKKRILGLCIPLACLLLLPFFRCAQAAAELPSAMRTRIDAVVAQELASTGVPSASIAVVIDSRIAYRKAYGSAQLLPRRAADGAMRYGIGSISKQFVASALLVLESQGRLS